MTSVFFHLSGMYVRSFYTYIKVVLTFTELSHQFVFLITCLDLIIDRMYVNASNDCNCSE